VALAPDAPALLPIGQAAARCGVSERALRYYQELGLLTPSGRTPGGLRRYAQVDLDRVNRIRELQTLLGLNLDEVRVVLGNQDRLAALREEYRAARPGSARRRDLIKEGLTLRVELRTTVLAKRDALQRFLEDLDAESDRIGRLLDDGGSVDGAPAGGVAADGVKVSG
jgi:DNA-binding transcriptional MerR regulator